MVHSLVCQNLVGREAKTIGNGRHDLLSVFLIERKDTVENSDLG
jgi:hypothetical protein